MYQRWDASGSVFEKLHTIVLISWYLLQKIIVSLKWKASPSMCRPKASELVAKMESHVLIRTYVGSREQDEKGSQILMHFMLVVENLGFRYNTHVREFDGGYEMHKVFQHLALPAIFGLVTPESHKGSWKVNSKESSPLICIKLPPFAFTGVWWSF
jgi:hypothetical protein